MQATFVIVLVGVVGLAMAWDLDDPEVKKQSDECAKENNVDTSFFEQYLQGKPVDMAVFDKKEYKCYVRCLHLKSGLISEAGEPNIENIKKYFEIGDDVIEEHKKCFTENKDTDLCDKAFNVQVCIIKKMLKM